MARSVFGIQRQENKWEEHFLVTEAGSMLFRGNLYTDGASYFVLDCFLNFCAGLLSTFILNGSAFGGVFVLVCVQTPSCVSFFLLGNGDCRHLASASNDYTVRVWDTVTYQTLFCLSSHRAPVTCLRWGGSGLIYSGSQDSTIKVYRANDGALCRILKGHAHWVNTIALNTDYVMRTGPYDPSKASANYMEVTENMSAQLAALALQRYEAATRGESEIMVSGSEDFTMILWAPEKKKQLIARMTGHHHLINDVKFSPDMRKIATASFDKSIKLWDGRTGKFLASLHGHFKEVYRISWSADSRLLVSGGADSILKLWNMETYEIMVNLRGHSDVIYTVDFSPDGQRVVSGGKDKVIKIWRQ